MKRLLPLVLSGFLTTPAWATPLRIVEVAAPDINCVFDADCRITVDDSTGPVALPAASGEGFLQSRTAPLGEPGTPGEGLISYEYRIDLRRLVGLTAIPCITELTIDFGPVRPLDYDGNGDLEDVYVVTRGGLGSVSVASAEQTGVPITFRFRPAVCAGGRPGGGHSTYFFGLAAEDRPGPVTARALSSLGDVLHLEARAPALAGGGVVPPPVALPAPCLPGLPISKEVPICRCLRDTTARELVCGVLHPHFLLVRRTPLPIPHGKPFTVRWRFVPLDRLSSAVVVEDGLPPGFTRPQGKPMRLVFAPGVEAGKGAIGEYQLLAPRQGEELSLQSLVTFGPLGGQGEPESFQLLLPIGLVPRLDFGDVPSEPRPRPSPPPDPDFGPGPCGVEADRLWDEHLNDRLTRRFGPSFGEYNGLRDRAERCRRVVPSFPVLCGGAGERAFARCFLQRGRDCHGMAELAIAHCRGPRGRFLDELLGGPLGLGPP